MKKGKLLKELRKLQQGEKERARRPEEKVIEEAAEVVMAHLGSGNLAEEKMDLLMSLVAWMTTADLKQWMKKMEERGRTPTTNQQKFINTFGG